MTDARRTQLSKFLSLVLRHQPSAAGVTLDDAGWVDVDVLLAGCVAAGQVLSRDELDDIVATSPKKRFALSADGRRIRASQGHSVEVALGYAPQEPPDVLYHGTHQGVVEAILADGLRAMARQHVHLSSERSTAVNVGARHGKPVVFEVAAATMHSQGHVFYRADNGVWLVAAVPPVFLTRT